ncbi:16S rRNA (cytidine(1402)-2'-O)-methyltransferase [Desulfovibrio sp. OttesenSCG-928-F07]|nr:16S rRNA (cytidine(1402)-2'-O)-methyltransferase [Desulfovibrio sp. OttesenSCG-928-F07]
MSFPSQKNLQAGELRVVATPLGNPGDLSPRAKEALATADCILAEDTRRTGLLLAQCGIKATRMASLHDHNEEKKLNSVLQELEQGKNLALVSDAGTPLLSDPGYRLVRSCREAGFTVRPLPGPSAPLTALCASGLPPQPFIFLGFPPRKTGEQNKFFAPYATLSVTVIFFERKDRLHDTLNTLYHLYGKREVCVARELTKTYEEFIHLYLDDLSALPQELLGEITVIVGPPLEDIKTPQESVLALAKELQQENNGTLKPRALAKLLKDKTSGWSTDDIYALLGRQ